jgi:PIN like domain
MRVSTAWACSWALCVMTSRTRPILVGSSTSASGLCSVTSTDVLDEDWIPVVAARGWLTITRDSKIIENRNEINAVREGGAKMVALNQQDARAKWGQLEVFMTRWRDIERLTAERGPFIWRASRTAMTPIPLDS